MIFDLDGTLADTSADLLAAANSCFDRLGHGRPLTLDSDRATAFAGGRAMLRLGRDRLGLGWDEAGIDREYLNLLSAYGEALDVHTRLYPGAVEAAELLRSRGYALGVCTNKPSGLAETLLGRLGVRGLFGSMVGADSYPVRKPDPLPYREAVRLAGGDIDRSLLVGDTITDVLTARAVGRPIVLVTFGPEGRGVESMAPDALLDAYGDLPDLAARMIPA